MSLTDTIKQEARALGLDAVGVSRIESPPRSSAISNQPTPLPTLLHERLMEWLERGYQGVMAWMGREPAHRADPAKVLDGCRSIISVGINYASFQRADESPGHGRVARYAWGKDYHRVLGDRLAQLEARIATLAPDARTRSYVDTGPVMEKPWAQQAGLGWIGKHSNLVSPHYGSWLLLGEILTTLELDHDEPGTDLCGSCSLCIQACPTGAITEPYVVDARRCISYLTIELRGAADKLPDDLAPKLGNRIFGCDDCLDICPYNTQAPPGTEPAFQPSGITLAPRLSELAAISEADFIRMFRESPIKRTTYVGLRRNVAQAMHNERYRTGDPQPDRARCG
ncbi:MAG: tRNA epoxyqueuosine(34) reductase QueG [Nitrospiraceae bacterium]